MRKGVAGPRGGPAHPCLRAVAGSLALLLALTPVAADARIPSSYKAVRAEVVTWQQYRVQPLWIDEGRLRPEARQLVALVRSARIDGLDPKNYRVGSLQDAVEDAERGNPRDLARADLMLSQALVALSRDMRDLRSKEMNYVDRAAIPTLSSTGLLLTAAAKAPSFGDFLETMPWMHPAYARLREAALNTVEPRQAHILRVNMERARALPGALQGGRYVLVDSAAARLYMVEDGVVQGTMKVVVGRLDNQTPMMAGVLRYAILNPYWNVPPDLAATRLAPRIVSDGLSYLKKERYEVLSDWGDKPRVVDPRKIDWKAAVAGKLPDLRLRQLPGPGNSMGKMKFMFPNDLGIYLHDTDDRSLFAEPARMRSGGCIRLQNAKGLARWLFGKPLVATSTKPEQKVAVPTPVPVYVTYLTAAPEDGKIAYRDDFYGRDGYGVRGTPLQTAAR